MNSFSSGLTRPSHRAVITPASAGVGRGDRERHRLGPDHVDAHRGGGGLVVPHRAPGPADPAVHGAARHASRRSGRGPGRGTRAARCCRIATPRSVGAGSLSANSKPNSENVGGVRPLDVPPVNSSQRLPQARPRKTRAARRRRGRSRVSRPATGAKASPTSPQMTTAPTSATSGGRPRPTSFGVGLRRRRRARRSCTCRRRAGRTGGRGTAARPGRPAGSGRGRRRRRSGRTGRA